MNTIFRYVILLTVIVTLVTGCERESLYHTKAKPEVFLNTGNARLQSNLLHFSKDSVYILVSDLSRNAGQSLVIEAGTLVKVNDKVAITIGEGATIDAKGTSSDPIVFTSSANRGGAGAISGSTNNSDRFWYGLRIYGNALNQPGTSSGTISFVRIEFAGGNDNFLGLPSLLLQNIDKATKLDNIQVSYSYSTSSFEFNGGDCNALNLVSYASGGNDFYLREGYKGKLQNLLAYRHPYFPAGTGVFSAPLGGVVLDGVSTFPVISNLSVIGPGLQDGVSIHYTVESGPRAGLIVNNGAKFMVRNSVLLGFPIGGFYMNDKNSAIALQSGQSEFMYSIVHSNDINRSFYLPSTIYPPFVSADFKSFMLEQRFGNNLFTEINEFMLVNPFEYDNNPDPLPKTGSPLLTGANFDGGFADPFFKKVSYRGALGTENWMQHWTNFKPLQTNYNN
ncbi:MAG: hypothetical protein ABIR18_04055 [Chitinophagaceae bacterium]